MAPDLGRKVDRNFTPATDLALATGMPVKVSPKFWAEHMGIPKTRLMLSVDQRERLFEPEWLAVAVGMLVTQHPPHKTVRARLTHTASTLDGWRQSAP